MQAVRSLVKKKRRNIFTDTGAVFVMIHDYIVKKCVEKVDSRKLAKLFPDLYEADCIREEQETTTRWMLEALIVANASRDSIAEYLATTPEVVKTYEDVFFDVRSRLKSKGFISGVLIGAANMHPSKEDPDKYWKMLAMAGGEPLLHSYWEHGVLPSDIAEHMENIIRGRTIHNAVDAAYCMPFTMDSTIQVAQLHNEIKKLELAVAQAKLATTADSDQTKALVASLGFVVASVKKYIAPAEGGKFVEPRADDQLKENLALVASAEDTEDSQ